MNQFKKRQEVFLVPVVEEKALCPVKTMMKGYNHLLQLGRSKFLFPNLKGDRMIIPESRISYSNLRQQWIKLLEKSGIPEERMKEFCLHSLRISAAMRASIGCKELEVQRSGNMECLMSLAGRRSDG